VIILPKIKLEIHVEKLNFSVFVRQNPNTRNAITNWATATNSDPEPLLKLLSDDSNSATHSSWCESGPSTNIFKI